MATSELRHDVKIIDRPPGVRLYRGSAMVAAAVVLALVFNAANLPSPLYVIYKDRFGFSEITLTLVFAVYVVGSVVAMTVFGRLSDYVGRRPVLFAAIALSAVSAVIFLVTFNTATLFAARIVSGLSIGLVATACTAWIAELQPEGDKGAVPESRPAPISRGSALDPWSPGCSLSWRRCR